MKTGKEYKRLRLELLTQAYALAVAGFELIKYERDELLKKSQAKAKGKGK